MFLVHLHWTHQNVILQHLVDIQDVSRSLIFMPFISPSPLETGSYALPRVDGIPAKQEDCWADTWGCKVSYLKLGALCSCLHLCSQRRNFKQCSKGGVSFLTTTEWDLGLFHLTLLCPTFLMVKKIEKCLILFDWWALWATGQWSDLFDQQCRWFNKKKLQTGFARLAESVGGNMPATSVG